MENKKLLREEKLDPLTLQIFKLLDVNELTEDAYEIIGTNPDNGEGDSVTTNTSQGAFALVDNIILELDHSSRRTK